MMLLFTIATVMCVKWMQVFFQKNKTNNFPQLLNKAI